MKRLGRQLLVPVLLLLPVAAGFFWVRHSSGFATPAACVEAYYQAATAGKQPESRSACLTPSLRNELARSEHFKKLHDLKNWVEVGDPTIDGAKAHVDIDERHAEKRQRVRYHLKKQGGGWLIDAIDPPLLLPEHVPYGTHVSKEGS